MTKDQCEALRRDIKAVTDKVWAMRSDNLSTVPGETISNVMLAFRHLEDASMRLGKAIQALDGGISVYDRTQVPAA